MLRQAPPLEAVEIFVAAAMGGSFRAVARELALSPSAVSRRIAALEQFLDIQLFERSRQTCTLSPAGERYLAMVEPAIAAIKRAGARLAEPSEPLRIAASHSLSATWLLPRLADLRRAIGVDVEVVATRDLRVLRSGEAQLAIWGAIDAPDDFTAERICDAPLFPVCAPALLAGRASPRRPADLQDQVLLEVRTPARTWERWFTLSGCEPKPLQLRRFDTLQLSYEAAAAGLGVCLAAPLTAEPFLHAGKLVPCGPRQSIGEAYYLCRLARRAPLAASERSFTAWVRREALKSVDDFAALKPARPAYVAPVRTSAHGV
jgi:LysR family glycine cleavage system transcriptional activator